MSYLYVSVIDVVVQPAGTISTFYSIARPTPLAHLHDLSLLLPNYRSVSSKREP